MNIQPWSLQTQSFCSLRIKRSAADLLKERNTTKAERKIIHGLMESQKNNPVQILLDTDDEKKLTATFYAQKLIYKKCSEGKFEQMIHRPLKFIQKCCKIADNYKDKYFKTQT